MLFVEKLMRRRINILHTTLPYLVKLTNTIFLLKKVQCDKLSLNDMTFQCMIAILQIFGLEIILIMYLFLEE